MTGYFERTPNGTLILQVEGHSSIVVEIVDRFGQKIYPDPVATDAAQSKIDERLQQVTEQINNCPHGLPRGVCMICPGDGEVYV